MLSIFVNQLITFAVFFYSFTWNISHSLEFISSTSCLLILPIFFLARLMGLVVGCFKKFSLWFFKVKFDNNMYIQNWLQQMPWQKRITLSADGVNKIIYLLKRGRLKTVDVLKIICNVLIFFIKIVSKYRISSNKRRASNKRRPLISATPLVFHIEISTSF